MEEQLAYEMSRWRLDEQLRAVDKLNDRLTAIFAAATAMLIVFAALQGTEVSFETIELALIGDGAFFYVLLVIVTLLGMVDARLNLGPELSELMMIEETAGDPGVWHWVAAEIVRAVEENELAIDRKSKRATWAVRIWFLAVLMLVASALISAT